MLGRNGTPGHGLLLQSYMMNAVPHCKRAWRHSTWCLMESRRFTYGFRGGSGRFRSRADAPSRVNGIVVELDLTARASSMSEVTNAGCVDTRSLTDKDVTVSQGCTSLTLVNADLQGADQSQLV